MSRSVCLLFAFCACHLLDPKPGLEMILAVESTDPVALQQTVVTLRNRLERAGVRGSKVEARADSKVRVLLPASDDPERVRTFLTRSARLEFRIVDDEATVIRELALPPGSAVEHGTDRHNDWRSDRVYEEHYLSAPTREQIETVLADAKIPAPLQVRFGDLGDGRVRTYLVREAELTGDSIESAEANLDETIMTYNVFIHFDAQGTRMFTKLTEENVQRKLAIVLDDEVMSAPVIQERISGGSAQVTMGGGRDPRASEAEARNLAAMLAAGALPVPVTVESETVLTP
jgi:preprotein translocase subunit SecD